MVNFELYLPTKKVPFTYLSGIRPMIWGDPTYLLSEYSFFLVPTEKYKFSRSTILNSTLRLERVDYETENLSYVIAKIDNKYHYFYVEKVFRLQNNTVELTLKLDSFTTYFWELDHSKTIFVDRLKYIITRNNALYLQTLQNEDETIRNYQKPYKFIVANNNNLVLKNYIYNSITDNDLSDRTFHIGDKANVYSTGLLQEFSLENYSSEIIKNNKTTKGYYTTIIPEIENVGNYLKYEKDNNIIYVETNINPISYENRKGPIQMCISGTCETVWGDVSYICVNHTKGKICYKFDYDYESDFSVNSVLTKLGYRSVDYDISNNSVTYNKSFIITIDSLVPFYNKIYDFKIVSWIGDRIDLSYYNNAIDNSFSYNIFGFATQTDYKYNIQVYNTRDSNFNTSINSIFPIDNSLSTPLRISSRQEYLNLNNNQLSNTRDRIFIDTAANIVSSVTSTLGNVLSFNIPGAVTSGSSLLLSGAKYDNSIQAIEAKIEDLGNTRAKYSGGSDIDKVKFLISDSNTKYFDNSGTALLLRTVSEELYKTLQQHYYKYGYKLNLWMSVENMLRVSSEDFKYFKSSNIYNLNIDNNIPNEAFQDIVNLVGNGVHLFYVGSLVDFTYRGSSERNYFFGDNLKITKGEYE